MTTTNGTGYPIGIPEHICDMFVKLALQAKAAGQSRWSARNIFHVMRWESLIVRGDEHFKVNNNYSARLARWTMKTYPELAGFFETRDQQAKHDMTGWLPSSVLD